MLPLRFVSLLAAQQLGVTLDHQPILRDLSFTIEAGEWVGVLGPNGSGKTTLLRTISGLLPHDGRLHLNGRPVAEWPARVLARQLAFVRQAPTLTFDFRVEELVLLGRVPHRSWLRGPSPADRTHVREALRRVDLDGFADRSVLTLSGGEMQRVFLAQALVQEAELLLLDEPTAHLDVHYQFDFMEQVDALADTGRTVIAVFHDLELAARHAERLLILHDGTLVADGPPADVLTSPLIARVFQMDADVGYAPDGAFRIDYRGPAASRSSASPAATS